MGSSPLGTDRGLTRLESTLVTALVIVVLAVAALTLVRTYTTTLPGQTTAQVPVQVEEAPVSVSVAAAGTVATPPTPQKPDRKDACPDLRGRQPAGFDCTLPLYVPALDLSTVRVKAPYQCADPENYRLVNGQEVQKNKTCVLKTAKAGQP